MYFSFYASATAHSLWIKDQANTLEEGKGLSEEKAKEKYQENESNHRGLL